VLGVAQVPGAVEGVEACGDQAGSVADVVQPGGGFQQISVAAEGWRKAACLCGDALDVCPAARQGVLEERPAGVSMLSRLGSQCGTFTGAAGRLKTSW
jgi:hypothetical protein